jgi:hypothetical protein
MRVDPERTWRGRLLAAGAVVAAAFALSVPLPAGATGTTRLQQADGSRQNYPGVTIRILKGKNQITVTSPDGKDTLTLTKAACSFVGDLQRCLFGEVELTKHGQTRVLSYDQGTIYLNLTEKPLALPLSSRQVPANGIILALHTTHGTFINVTGTIDGTLQ